MKDLLKISAIVYFLIVLAKVHYDLTFTEFFSLSIVGAFISGTMGAMIKNGIMSNLSGRERHGERLKHSSQHRVH